MEEKEGENEETELNVLAPGTQERAREKGLNSSCTI